MNQWGDLNHTVNKDFFGAQMTAGKSRNAFAGVSAFAISFPKSTSREQRRISLIDTITPSIAQHFGYIRNTKGKQQGIGTQAVMVTKKNTL